jgi:hypothetical protein
MGLFLLSSNSFAAPSGETWAHALQTFIFGDVNTFEISDDGTYMLNLITQSRSDLGIKGGYYVDSILRYNSDTGRVQWTGVPLSYNIYLLDTALHNVAASLDNYATLSGDNIFRGVQYYYDTNGTQKALLTGRDGYGELWLADMDGNLQATYMNGTLFRLAGSGNATGIDFASNVTAGTTYESHLATTGSVSQMLSNNYYMKV